MLFHLKRVRTKKNDRTGVNDMKKKTQYYYNVKRIFNHWSSITAVINYKHCRSTWVDHRLSFSKFSKILIIQKKKNQSHFSHREKNNASLRPTSKGMYKPAHTVAKRCNSLPTFTCTKLQTNSPELHTKEGKKTGIQ